MTSIDRKIMHVCLLYISESYPQFEPTDATVEVWLDLFAGKDAGMVKNAIQEVLRDSNRPQNPPKPGEVMGVVQRNLVREALTPPKIDAPRIGGALRTGELTLEHQTMLDILILQLGVQSPPKESEAKEEFNALLKKYKFRNKSDYVKNREKWMHELIAEFGDGIIPSAFRRALFAPGGLDELDRKRRESEKTAERAGMSQAGGSV